MEQFHLVDTADSCPFSIVTCPPLMRLLDTLISNGHLHTLIQLITHNHPKITASGNEDSGASRACFRWRGLLTH